MIKYGGEQAFNQIFNLIKGVFDDKVDKDGNKGLSTNDYTDKEKQELSTIAPTSNIFATAEVID